MMEADGDETTKKNKVEGKRNESALASSHCPTVGPKRREGNPRLEGHSRTLAQPQHFDFRYEFDSVEETPLTDLKILEQRL